MTSGSAESSPRRPSGAAVAVVSHSPDGPRHLILQSCEVPPGEEWSWGSPSGCLEPGEDIATCAARELYEETGIRAEPLPIATEDIGWALFYLEVPWGTAVRLDPAEHTRFNWVTFDEACRRVRPALVADGLRRAVEAGRKDTRPDVR